MTSDSSTQQFVADRLLFRTLPPGSKTDGGSGVESKVRSLPCTGRSGSHHLASHTLLPR